MNYLAPATADLFRKNLNLGIFFRLDHPDPAGVLRIWLGVNNVRMKMTGVETTLEIYYGAGRLQSVPDLEAIINDGATRLEITIEGISDDAQAQIDDDPPNVVGRKLHIGMAAFDAGWQATIMDILPLQHAIADYWSMTGSVVSGARQQTRTLSLSASVGQTGRSRPRRATYTQAQQQFLFPTDDFCLNVARYDRGYSLAWPNFVLWFLIMLGALSPGIDRSNAQGALERPAELVDSLSNPCRQ